MTPDCPLPSALLHDLDFSTGELLAQGNQGEVRRFCIHDHDIVIKAPKGRGLAWRARRAGLRREHRAWQRLDGLPGFPACLGFFQDRWLVLEYVAGTPFREACLKDREHFFNHLLQVIEAMHARGVAHGDLKRKDNLIVTATGQPVVLDLGAATVLRSGRHPLNRKLFDFMRQTDLNAWVKLKYQGYDGVSAKDRPRLRRSGLERALSRWRGT